MKEKKFNTLIFLISFILAVVYFIIYLKNSFNHVDYMYEIINACFLLGILILIGLIICGNKALKNIIGYVVPIIVIAMILFNILTYKDIIKLPKNLVMKDFKNVSLVEAIKWSNDNKIKLNSSYEYSDNIIEGNIITQDVNPNTILKKIKEFSVVVSSGPNYDKELILSNMVDLDLDSLIKFIDENHLNNITLNYEISEKAKDTVISQSTMGDIKRNTPITFTISLGRLEDLKDVVLEDLTNKKEFDATLYLKKNGIKYEISYEFSSSIKKGYVISHDPSKGKQVKPLNDTIKLVISKGKEITIPDFKDLNDVITFVTNNNLKISFNEKYDTNIEKGKLISINYKKGDVISEGTKIIATLSKGCLTLPKFNSFNDFMIWANTYGIHHQEQYEYNDSVKRGNIISISKNTGDKIDVDNDNLIVKISYGSPVTVPNIIGKSKGEIVSICNNIGLSCGYYNTGYSNAAKDTATAQSINPGSKVVSGTYMNIGLSNGPAETFNMFIQDTWLGTSADATINSLRNQLAIACPGVNFRFEKHADNSSPAGFIHPSSPIRAGNNSFTQGQTYTIWVVE